MTRDGFGVTLAARPNGRPKTTDFGKLSFTLAPLQRDEVLLKTDYLSLDPYMRGRMDEAKSYDGGAALKIGDIMMGATISTVIESRNSKFKVGDFVFARSGWRTLSIADGEAIRKIDPVVAPASAFLGILGTPGFTAYAGLKLIGKPKAGDTVVVAAASGGVGSLVGQLAKKYGARAVGIAGGPEKCAFAESEYGFDAVIDHKSKDFPAQLSAVCPKGIDVYFENVGGPVWQAVLPLLNNLARVPVCGLISQYNQRPNNDGSYSLAATMDEILHRSLTLRGFVNREFEEDHFTNFLSEIGPDVQSGRLRFREDFVEGLENAPEGLIGLLEGKNFGKTIVRLKS